MKDRDVYLQQAGLKSLGFDPGPLDGDLGPRTRAARAAWEASLAPQGGITGKASSFADPADVAAFKRCKATGKTDKQCFAVGDNGIGFTGMDCADPETPLCALPPDDWKVWGTKSQAAGRRVAVTYRGKTVIGALGDTMPAKANVKNGAVIDLNPGFAKAFGLKPPFMLDDVTWTWA